MYFSLLPDLKYDKKPIQYPFSESDFTIVKNLFTRFKLNEDVFSFTVLFRKYSVQDGERLETIAEKAYGNAFYDWIIAITNNMINPQFDLPLSEYDLKRHVEKNYDNPFGDIKYYEIVDAETQIDLCGRVLYPPETIVDETFYNAGAVFESEEKPELITPIVYDFDNFKQYEDYLQNSPGVTVEELNTIYESVGIDYESSESFFNEFQNPNSYGNGVSIRPSGNGSGSSQFTGPTSGFNIGSWYLEFIGSYSGPRQVQFIPLNTTNYGAFEIIAIRGNGTNGGETPDIFNSEELTLYASINNGQSFRKIENIIPINANGVAHNIPGLSTQLKRYRVELAPLYRKENVIFKLVQNGYSGQYFDRYGIRQVILDPDALEYETYTIINDEYHIIDGVDWIFVDNVWKKRSDTLNSRGIEYYDASTGTVKEIKGSQISRPVTQYEYEMRENEKKRDIYLLKPKFLNLFIDEFRKAAKYKKSSKFITSRLKESGT